MTEDRAEWQGTTFKSGNSVALRLPKGLGVPEGIDVRMVREAPMSFRVEPVNAPKRKFNIAKVAGSAKSLKYIAPENRSFEERPSATDPVKQD